ncbi:MAG TPA: cytidylate kinase-like family protein [Tepidisphaeraceae bacterium]|nr:cytidylate kinase-like family protein [Tepidisphaeraceae bacterium]
MNAYRGITISREYGSGGGSIARILGERLGWRVIDDCLIAGIAKSARAAPEAVRAHEETVDPWFHRITKALWRGGFEGSLSGVDAEAWDAAATAQLWHRVIREAAEIGHFVSVGRGGQCLLQKREDVFHIYVYAPMCDRVKRLRDREPAGIDLAEAARERDRRRAAYIRYHFDQEWTNPHLYHLMLCSSMGVKKAADVVLCAAGVRS